MIKDNQKYFNRLHVLIDALVIGLSYTAAWAIRFYSGLFEDEGLVFRLSDTIYLSVLLFVVPGYLLLNYIFNLYTPKRQSSARRDVVNVFKANVVGLVLFVAILYVIDQKLFSRSMLFIFAAFNTVGQSATRIFIRKILRALRKKGYNIKYVLLVGYSRAAEVYIDRIMENPQWGYYVRGILDDHIPRGTQYRGIKVIGSIENLAYILPENKLDEIAVTLSLKDYDRLEELVGKCEKSGVHTKFIPDYNSIIPSKPYMEDLDGLPVINIRHVPLTNTLNSFIKRIMDITGSLIAIILFSPLFLVIPVIIKLTSKGPVIFKQERVGLHNKPFQMYKFRTMKMQTQQSEDETWTKKGDPRVTGIGRFLRKTSLDEIPQFFNVLKGDMSLVGPRPERPHFVDIFKEQIPRYMIKHQVRPGITGWAQVKGYRGDTSIKMRIQYDVYYIENWTPGFDIKILFLTIFRGFINKNAI